MALQMFEADNIANRTKILLDQCTRTGKCTEDDDRALNAIDANITQILITAERRCERVHGLSNIMQGCSDIPPNMTREAAILSAKAQSKMHSESYGQYSRMPPR
jgi:hypothetical protein